jgi:chaperone modulatory protein CbpM
MTKPTADDVEVLGADTPLTIGELCRLCNVEITWIETLQAHGALAAGFTTTTMIRVRKARRLEQDLNLDTPSLALVLDLLDQIDSLEGELARHGKRYGS